MRAGEGPERKAADLGSREGPSCRGPWGGEGSQLSPGGTLSRGEGSPNLHFGRIGSGIGAENGLQEDVRAA